MTEDEKEICERFVRLIDTGFTPEEKGVLIPQLFHYYASFCAKDILMRLKSYGTRIDAEEVKKEAVVYGGLLENSIKTQVQLLINKDGIGPWRPSDN